MLESVTNYRHLIRSFPLLSDRMWTEADVGLKFYVCTLTLLFLNPLFMKQSILTLNKL